MVFAPLNATHYFEEARIFLRGTNGVAFRQNVLCSKPGVIFCLRLKCKKIWNLSFLLFNSACSGVDWSKKKPAYISWTIKLTPTILSMCKLTYI